MISYISGFPRISLQAKGKSALEELTLQRNGLNDREFLLIRFVKRDQNQLCHSEGTASSLPLTIYILRNLIWASAT